MTSFKRGDVVIVDLGFTAKVRPCVVVSVSASDSQRNMSIVVPMTTEARGGECEVSFPKPPWLKEPSVINVLGIAGVDNARILRRITAFPEPKMNEISGILLKILGLERSQSKAA